MLPNQETNGTQAYLKLLDETLYSAQLVKDSIDHFNDIIDIAKMPHAPEYTRQLLSMEFEQLAKAYRGLKEYETRFKLHDGASKPIIAFVEVMCTEFEEMKEKYENFMKIIR